MRYPVVFFDLDGTLTDPTEGITNSFRHALAQFDIAAEPAQLRALIGPPLHQSFQDAFGFDEATAWQAVEHYRDYFGERGILENRIFDGIPVLLDDLRAADGGLCVVTSKPAVYAERILAHFGIAAFFDAVVAPGLDLANAGKPELVRRALDRYAGREASGFVMVGDREHDVIGAVANGIDSIGVTYGAGSRDELASAGATHIVDTTVELRAALAE